MAEYLRTATHNHVVGILGPHNQRIRPWCHEVVEIPNRDSILSLDVITSRCLQCWVCMQPPTAFT